MKPCNVDAAGLALAALKNGLRASYIIEHSYLVAISQTW
jgi:hypothetical protein